jgi:hypothetical protein
VEWWDEHWIHDRIMSKLDPNAPKQDPAPVTVSATHVKARRRR